MSKRVIACCLLIALSSEMAFAGLGSKKVMYVGGTATAISERTEGTTTTKDEKEYVFTYPGGKLSIPYDQVDSLEYGQKAGRRVGLAVAITPFALFSKKRKHFLTISWKDEDDKQQAVVLELGKDIVRTELATLEARTGRKIEYQDDEARHAGKGN
ncbi:MAG TPA: hypothetical protein VN577_16395 [Terriglobales bacterium]|nr:hypothetical protein [Terriglobales bacterium]